MKSQSPSPKSDSSSIPSKNPPGENHAELEQIEVKFDQTSDEQFTSTNPKSPQNSNKHSPHHSHPTSSTGFSLKNPVSSFRSWVTNKKSSKEEPASSEHFSSKPTESALISQNSSVDSDSDKRIRTNSASITTNSNHLQDNQGSTRTKKKSSFSLRSNNPISLLKRTPETTTHTNESESSEATGGTGPFGYLKNLVRGEKQ